MSTVVASAADRRAETEQQLLQQDVEVRKLVLDAVRKSAPDIHVAESLIDGEVVRTIVGASQVNLTIHDQGRTILKSGALHDSKGHLLAIDIHLDGLWFRLAKATKSGDDLILAFEDRDVAYLRSKHGPRKLGFRKQGKNKGVTRAEAILILVRSVKAHKIPVRINELHKIQPVAKLTNSEINARRRSTTSKSDAARKAGFPEGAKIAGLNARQVWRIGRCLKTVQDIPGVGEREELAMLVAMAQESNFGEDVGSRGTTFQTEQIPETNLEEQAHYFMVGGKSFHTGGAIQAVKDHPTYTVGWIAVIVEAPGTPAAFGPLYDKHFPMARKILDAWNGTKTIGTQNSKIVTYKKRYPFIVQGKPATGQYRRAETYWDAIQRLASQVNWRAFITGGVFHYISEEDLFKSRPRAILKESLAGVENIDFDHDYRKTVSKATATVRINRWAIPPGVTVEIQDLGPANGRWLVETTTRNLFSSEATLDLKKPLPERAEPAPETGTKTKPGKGSSSPGGGGSLASFDGLAAPLEHILNHSNGYNPPVHDGVDLICGANALLYAICDCEVVDVRAGGWWGKGAPTGAALARGDGIIQIKCLVNAGPFKAGYHFGYGHAEHALVKVGDRVQAGQAIGHAGFANAWHTHFMVNRGHTLMGIGQMDPWPFVAYALRAQHRRHTPGGAKTDPEYQGANH